MVPSAVHAVADAHESVVKTENEVGFGVVCTAHAVPFQRSASVLLGLEPTVVV
jgi:hypothetical protein